MNHFYSDIIGKLGDPIWYDEYAVPRYCQFEPRQNADVYASEVCLFEIACQNCGQRFKVAMSWSDMEQAMRGISSLSERIANNTLHYGDPPNNCCCLSGPTMNSVPIRVLEFWKRINPIKDMERIPELERKIECSWCEED